MYYSPLLLPPQSHACDCGGPAVSHPLQSEDRPISLRSRQLVFENRVFRVFADHVSDTKGNEVPRYLNVVPKCATSDQITGVAVLPVHGGRFGLIRVFRHSLNRWSREVPKGFLDVAETPETAAVRELREETGFAVHPNQLVGLGTMAPDPGIVAGRVRLFLVKLEEADSSQAPDGELGHGDLTFFGRNDLHTLIACGELEDGCTMSLLLQYLAIQLAFC